MKTLVILFSGYNRGYELWDVEDEKDAAFRIKRRIEKEGKEASRAWLVSDEQELDVKKIIDDYYNEEARQARELAAASERREYERLKKKFEPPES